MTLAADLRTIALDIDPDSPDVETLNKAADELDRLSLIVDSELRDRRQVLARDPSRTRSQARLPRGHVVTLSHEDARLLAQYVVARNAQAWEIDWEDWPGLDEDSVNMLNDAIVDVGNWIERVTGHDEIRAGKDVRLLFEEATS